MMIDWQCFITYVNSCYQMNREKNSTHITIETISDNNMVVVLDNDDTKDDNDCYCYYDYCLY